MTVVCSICIVLEHFVQVNSATIGMQCCSKVTRKLSRCLRRNLLFFYERKLPVTMAREKKTLVIVCEFNLMHAYYRHYKQ